MFVIFGWQKTVEPKESLLKTDCHRCGKEVSWRIWHETEWVSLFFVRLLPLLTKHHLACEVCRDSLPLDAQTARRARNRHALDERARTQLHDDLLQRIEKHQLGGMTEGQRRYYKSTREQRAQGGGSNAAR